MPGQLLHRIATRVCPDETDRVFEPLIADLQREWTDSRPGSRRAAALGRAYWSFWLSVTACAARALIRGAVSPIDGRLAHPAMLAFVCAPLAVTLLRLVGASRAYWHQPLSAFILGELQAWSWAIVFAMAPAFMYARREPGRRWDATTSRLLAAGLLLSIASVGWVGPITFGVMEHAHGHFLDGRAQPAFASLPTVVRMVRAHATDANWPHFLTGRLIMIADALLLALIGWRLSAIRRPTIGRVTFWWFALMEFVLLSGGFAINQAEWQQWRASGVLVLILLALYVAAKRNRPDLSVRPTPPDPPGLPDVVS